MKMFILLWFVALVSLVLFHHRVNMRLPDGWRLIMLPTTSGIVFASVVPEVTPAPSIVTKR